jgi:hypothetical protein
LGDCTSTWHCGPGPDPGVERENGRNIRAKDRL